MNRPVGIALSAAVVGIAVIGTVVVSITPAGCRLGIQSSKCASAVALVTSPSPTQRQTPAAHPTDVLSATSMPPSPTPVPAPVLPPYEYTASQGAPPQWYGIASGSAPSGISLNLNCRLPIYAGPSGSGGFISFPGGTYTADPRSAVSLPTPPAGYTFPPNVMGIGPGMSGLTYDQAYDRWLPAAWRYVAPDGKHYAYLYPGDGVFVTNVSTGAQTELGQGHTWVLVDVESTGVYASMTAQGQPVPGLWWLPFSGQPSQLTTTGFWQREAAGFAYGTATSAVPNGVATLMLRLNLTTGAQEPWFEVDGATSTVVGFDGGGHPLIVANVNGYSALWVATGPGTAQVIDYQGLYQQGGNWYQTTADQNGIWESSGQSILLLFPGKAKWTMSSIGGQLAGGCQ